MDDLDFFAEEEELFAAEENKFDNEVTAFERAGPGRNLDSFLSIGQKIDFGGKKTREIISPEDRFLININSTCRRLDSENIVKITEKDILNMLENSKKIPELKYKNYMGYILGYIATNGGQNMKKVKAVINDILPHIKEGGIEPADVVRYARFWTKFL